MSEGFIGFLLGMLFVVLVIRQLFKHIEHQVAEAMNTGSSDQDQLKLRVELVENQLLCYNNSTMAFICQGSSLKEVLDNFNKRFPGQDVTLVSEDAGLIENLSKQKQLLDV
jgi:hypothetical protein